MTNELKDEFKKLKKRIKDLEKDKDEDDGNILKIGDITLSSSKSNLLQMKQTIKDLLSDKIVSDYLKNDHPKKKYDSMIG